MRLEEIHPNDIEKFRARLVANEEGCVVYQPATETRTTVSVRAKFGATWKWTSILATTLNRLILEVPGKRGEHPMCGTKGCCNPFHQGTNRVPYEIEAAKRRQERKAIRQNARDPKKGDEEEFWSLAVKHENTGCLVWTEAPTRNRKGTATYSYTFRGVRESIGRIAYRIEHGSIPRGVSVVRGCGNPACINPSHLSLR